MKYDLVIFDWDGTLMDSAAKIVKCMQLAAQDAGLAIPSREAAENIIGISLVPATAQLFDEDNPEVVAHIVNRYKFHYINSDKTPCPLFPGIIPLLDALEPTPATLAVATGKARRGLERAWDNTETRHYFSHSRCADEAESKPSSDMLLQLLDETGIDIQKSVMIGDTTYDMQMAEQIGMDRIGVDYGVHGKHRLNAHQPVFVAESVAELHQYLLRA
ncbi:HAD-IA family hydrolase [Alteromonas oceanisediminis]|uniref:HAD-IA family hydrolase n=1 Tax=Alteromonas oceanisediminis TaxID=2836180 RepID=UPI001BD9639A|nr:HAD-IA family hydrolase [Alteromonas oceanisediminis]MBT0586442.1 HAD-IA family hydrolase [Alteromonas oceanisediminis]